MTQYAEFLLRKQQCVSDGGFAPLWMPDCLFDFQAFLTEWALRKGRSLIAADCGLGKTLMELVFAENVARKTNKPVIILTPLAVAQQFVREGEKFGIEVEHSRDGKYSGKIVVTNYERLHYFDPAEFGGGVADEASAIKAFDGKRRKQVTRLFSKFTYRLLATATPAPNDYIELGTASECLGVMTQSDMLGYFFVETENMRHTLFREGDFWNRTKWSFKPHSEQPFWKWVASWARAIRQPSDLGFDDTRFTLPGLKYNHHIVDIPWSPKGELFPRPAITLREQADERKRTIRERCEKVAELVDHDRPAVVWCHYNEEGDMLEQLIPGCVQVAGKQSMDEKEEALTAFTLGQVRVLVSKTKIGCWGLNWQHCGDMTFFPMYSFEQMYQGVRRCWRFGRTDPVNVEIVSVPGESKVVAGLDVKQEQAQHMFISLVRHMNEAIVMNSEDRHTESICLPSWIPFRKDKQCPLLTSA